MSSSTRNYHAHGGNEWIVCGKMTFLPGAVVEGAEGLFDPAPAAKLPFVAESDATTVAALREDFNALLTVLKAAGIMETEAAAPTE